MPCCVSCLLMQGALGERKCPVHPESKMPSGSGERRALLWDRTGSSAALSILLYETGGGDCLRGLLLVAGRNLDGQG